MKHSRFLSKSVVLAVSALLVTSCGASPSATVSEDQSEAQETFQKFDEMDAGSREAELVKAAQAEGSVVAYLRSDDVFEEIEKSFEDKYGIDLQIVNPGRMSVVRQQIFEQANANNVQADVLEIYTHELNTSYAEQGILAKVPNFIAESAASPDQVSDYAVETIQYPFLPVWNTNKVKSDDAPQTIQDFSKPFWKNNLALAQANDPWYVTEFQRLTAQGMSVDEFETLFKHIAKNSSNADHNVASAGIGSGQYAAGVGIALVTAQRVGSDAPLSWDETEDPTILIPAGVGLVREAKHPAAALLFEQWYLDEGSDIIAKEQFVQNNPTETDLQGYDFIRPDFSELDSKKLEEWRIAYDNLLKGRGDIVPAYVREEQ